MSFQFTYSPTSVSSYAPTTREKTMPYVLKMIADLSTGEVRVWRGKQLERVKILYSGAAFSPTNFETTFNLYDNEQALWQRVVGDENVPALLALRAAGKSPNYQGTKYISFSFDPSTETILGGPAIYPPSLPNPSAATLASLSPFYDPSKVADATLPMTLVGDRDLPNFFPGTPYLEDYLRGALGDDVLVGQLGKDTLVGGGGNDELYGGYANDSLIGDVGDDFLYGEQQNDTLNGGDGNDFLDGGLGTDVMSGGKGNDIYIVDNARDVVTDLGSSTDFDQVLIVSYLAYVLPINIEGAELEGKEDSTIDGNNLSNDIAGNTGNNDLEGGSGNDSLDGAAGSDLLTGGIGDDSLDGSAGNDALNGGVDNDTLIGGGGVNTLIGGAGNDMFDATGGRSLVSYEVVTANLSIDLAGEIAMGDGTDRLIGVTNLASGSGNDRIEGTESGDKLAGNAGHDRIDGGQGNDSLTGGLGADTLVGGLGINTLVGGTGGDYYIVEASRTKIIESSTAFEIDTVESSISSSIPTNIENLILTGDAERGSGNAVGNVIRGNDGNNVLFGYAGSDSLLGGDGDDSLVGAVVGGALNEKDTLTGGAGADIFVLASNGALYDDGSAATDGKDGFALITDFDPATDRLLLKGNASSYFLGNSPFGTSLSASALFRDTNGSGQLEGVDEVIALLEKGSATTLTAANTIGAALFAS